MLISHDWLRAFVPHGRGSDEIRDLISAHVATVDSVERLRDDLRPIVIARVLTAGHHPNSDHLWVTTVDDGTGAPVDVVCGAPNVTVGALYPFARVGTVMPSGNKGGTLIERRKIRGAVSAGMLCSAKELGLGEDHDGILALELEAAPGTPLLDVMQVGDIRYDIDVLPNRPDLLSHQGMAREIAAITGAPCALPAELGVEPELVAAASGVEEATSAGATIRIEYAAGCPRFMGVTIRGVRVGPSPEWLVARLASVGVRSISNIVDVTNYMVHGLGQPMHAYDLAKVAGRTLVARLATAGERLTTLDGVERSLDERMTVIADLNGPVGVAGVMGGLASEVTDGTTDLFLEAAYFDPARTRVTRRALGLSTDASYRFERGIDPEGTPRAIAIAAQLICSLSGGRIDGVPIDVGAPPPHQPPVHLRPARLSRLLGATVGADEIATRLTSVGFKVTPVADGAMHVLPPSWRHDVSRDADLVEEVARLRGYDTLSDELTPFRPGTVPDHPLHTLGRRLRDCLVGRGLSEVRPLPFVKGADDTHIRVVNPLADDEPHLRTRVLDTLAKRAEYNLTRMEGNVRLFEIGSVFEKSGAALPRESVRVGVLVMGARQPAHFTDTRPAPFDAWDVRALGEAVARIIDPVHPAVLVPVDGDERILWRVVSAGGATVGSVERVALDRPVWAAEAFGIEWELGVLSNAPVAPPGTHVAPGALPALQLQNQRDLHQQFRPLPTTPPAVFDVALLVPGPLSAEAVERVIRESAGELLEKLTLFDDYRGQGLPDGYRSVAWRLTFRDPVRTLRDKEIEGRRLKILKALEGELGVRPRSV
ncbi:MAG: phenylalanine--tRNA ligase subunit beta [Gemmatimonadaceae bacterium]